MLFKQGPAAELKDELVTKGILHAVIALPPMWIGASVGTNLLVLDMNPSDTILFVDASDPATVTIDKRRVKTGFVLSEKAIGKIAGVVHEPRDITGFTKIVTVDEVRKKELNLVPANYVIQPTEEDTTTLEEIDKELAALYKQLKV